MIQSLPFFSLHLLIFLCWLTNDYKIIFSILSLTLGLLLYSQSINISGLGFISLGLITSFTLNKKNVGLPYRVVLTLLFLILSFGFLTHSLPGFNNLKLFEALKVSETSAPFSFYFNYDKPFIAIFILLFFKIKKSNSFNDLILSILKSLPIASVMIFCLLALAYYFKYVQFDLKLPKHSLFWMLNNLFFVAFVEELFFRGVIQEKLCQYIGHIKNGIPLAILLTSILFGIGHYPGGFIYVILCTIAGLFYGYSYYKTQRIESSIFVHFSLNFMHYIFFSYPYYVAS